MPDHVLIAGWLIVGILFGFASGAVFEAIRKGGSLDLRRSLRAYEQTHRRIKTTRNGHHAA